MGLSYPELCLLHKTHPAWRLLRADHASLILSFIDQVFVKQNIRVMNQSNLVARLEDWLYHLRQDSGEQSYSRCALDYLDDWAQNEKGWLRKFYTADSDEPHFDLTPATETALRWVESLTARTFVGTESRLRTIFELLKEMVFGAETDVCTRIAELERRRGDLDAQISSIRNGEIPVMDETALRERFMQFSSMAKELLSDFRAVEHNFRQLDLQVREKIATWDGRKGELLEKIFGERDLITDSDQGRSFKGFWDFLMSSSSQEEFSDLLEKVFSMPAITALTDDKRLKRVHFDWLEAGEHTQRTVAGLSQQLRRYLDNQVYLENKRIMEILDSIAHHALAIKDALPAGAFLSIDNPGPTIKLPMERPLYSPPAQSVINSLVQEAYGEEVDAGALFRQVCVDKEDLRRTINRELQVKCQISLGDILRKCPLRRGLSELVAYLVIAGEDPLAVFDEDHTEPVQWIDASGSERHASVPRVIFSRM